MTKQEYINELKKGLCVYPTSFQNEILEAFEEHFNAGLAEGQSEEEIMTTLGTVEEVLQNIREMEEAPVTLVNLHHQEEQKKETEETTAEPFQDLADTIAKAVADSLKGIDGTVEEIVKKSIHVAEDAVKGIKRWNDDYETKHTKKRYYQEYYDTEDTVLEAEDCTKIQISIPLGDCDVEIYDAPTTSYHFENYHSLFSNSTASIHGTVSNDTLLLESTGGHVSGKLVVYVSNMVEQLMISTKSSDIDITNLTLDTLKIQSISGDIDIDCSTCEDTMISTTSGDIDLRRVNGSFMISTTSGDVEAMDVQAEQFTVQSTSGDIDFEGSCDALAIKTISGDVEITLEDTVTDARIQTTSGDVDLNVDNEDYNITIETMSGDVCNHTRMRAYKESHRCIRLGDGDADIAIATLSGDITIR
ncbi:MAG: DUF4097 family beta strand repeat protein [Erysipelotrichaceae bacterium]|nr:DUF4097 family beta strand repeat protein [Erysipelotrichaceae bacterium]